MKIIILGAGQVGSSVANNLASEANDITVVDQDSERLHRLQVRLDLRTVQGNGAHPDVLLQAGGEDAEMILAVTNSDETNIVACQVAYALFNTPTKIARVRASGFTEHQELFFTKTGADDKVLHIDMLISPEQEVTDYIMRLIEYPGALQVLDFARGRVRLVAVKALKDGPLVGNELRQLYEHMPDVDARVAAIYRKGKDDGGDQGEAPRAIRPEGHTVIMEGDEVFFIAAREDIRQVMSELGKLEKPFKRLIFAGGGNIGKRLAGALEKRFQVKLIEKDKQRADQVSVDLNNTIVLEGDVADEDLLREENIENTDVFCAVTNDDEANILSAMLAKRLGARKVMALINRHAYVDMVQSGPIDIAISPQQATIGSLLQHVRQGDVVKVHSLRHGAAEAIEAVAHGDASTSKVVGRTIDDIDLPEGASIGAIVRGGEVLIAHHDSVIEPEDHVILFLMSKRHVKQVERLFQVGITFL